MSSNLLVGTPSISSPPVAGQPTTVTGAPKKMCCACPDTKKVRDECIAKNGMDSCAQVIELHKVCLRAEGFNI